MKSAITALVGLAVLLLTGTAVNAELESASERPFMGVLIDPAPLPGLLTKHLGLDQGQGLRVQNVQKGSPADKTGLERDDLIIGFEGDDVHGYEQFVDAIRDAGSGTEVSVQIIHLGARKTVKLTLRPYKGEPDWKYPREPEAVQSWRPGRFFRLRPGDEDWTEMLRDNLPPDVDIDIKKFFNEVRTYHHSNGEDYTVIIEGSPHDEDSKITVRIGDDEYTATLKEVDKLPKEYREAAKDAMENAKKESTGLRRFNRRFDRDVRSWPPERWREYFDRIDPRNFGPMPRFDRSDEIFDRIQKQMRELRERLDKLEERHWRNRDEDVEEPDKSKNKEPKDEGDPALPTGKNVT